MSIALALSLLAMEPSIADVLHGIAGVESRHRINAPDGDRHFKRADGSPAYCLRARGMFQVTPRAVRELVRVGRLDAADIPGFSLTNCTAVRKWLAVPANNYKAARLYLLLMLEESGDIETALCRYNGPRNAKAGCVYAGEVLLIAAGGN